ncbi:hypothetical protein DFH07DRAFT_1012996, partial [Mycena maculata]
QRFQTQAHANCLIRVVPVCLRQSARHLELPWQTGNESMRALSSITIMVMMAFRCSFSPLSSRSRLYRNSGTFSFAVESRRRAGELFKVVRDGPDSQLNPPVRQITGCGFSGIIQGTDVPWRTPPASTPPPPPHTGPMAHTRQNNRFPASTSPSRPSVSGTEVPELPALEYLQVQPIYANPRQIHLTARSATAHVKVAFRRDALSTELMERCRQANHHRRLSSSSVAEDGTTATGLCVPRATAPVYRHSASWNYAPPTYSWPYSVRDEHAADDSRRLIVGVIRDRRFRDDLVVVLCAPKQGDTGRNLCPFIPHSKRRFAIRRDSSDFTVKPSLTQDLNSRARLTQSINPGHPRGDPECAHSIRLREICSIEHRASKRGKSRIPRRSFPLTRHQAAKSGNVGTSTTLTAIEGADPGYGEVGKALDVKHVQSFGPLDPCTGSPEPHGPPSQHGCRGRLSHGPIVDIF